MSVRDRFSAGGRAVWLRAALAAVLYPPCGSAAGDVPALVQELRGNGAAVTRLGERSGLEGWLVERRGEAPYTVYVTGEGYAVLGLLYAPDGRLLSGDQIAAAVGGWRDRRAAAETGVGDVSATVFHEADLVDRAARAFGFTLGGDGPLVAMFADPECAFSRAAVAELGERAMDGAFRLRVVPVALLGEAAAMRAAGIAGSAQPAVAWFDDPLPATSAGAERIADNNALFDAAGGRGTPLILWRDGRYLARHEGAPADVDAWLADIAR